MRSSTFSTLALLASFFANNALAGPLGSRAIVTHEVVVYEVVSVFILPDGSTKTEKPKIVKTKLEEVTRTTRSKTKKTTKKVTSTTTTTTTSSPAATTTQPQPTTSSPPPPPPAVPDTQVQAAAFIESVVPPAVSSSSTTTTAPVATVAPPANKSNCKLGVPYNNADVLKAFIGTSACWAYNWATGTSPIPGQFEYVAMLWGDKSLGEWEQQASKAIASGTTHLLGYNEPDHWEQANADPAYVAASHIKNMNPFADRAKLGSPAVTNGQAPMGLDWLSRFIDACAGACKLDFIAIHWYNGGDAAAFKAHVEKAIAVGGGLPVWITEFEAPGSPAEKIEWLREVRPWLDSHPGVERYSYFYGDSTLTTGMALSEIGTAYVS